MTYRVSNFIDGETTESRSERFGAIFNPATGQQQGQVVLSTAAECQDAIASAERALADWAQTPPLVRARVLFRFKELMEQHRETRHEQQRSIQLSSIKSGLRRAGFEEYCSRHLHNAGDERNMGTAENEAGH